jgi:hypothetical protein
VGVAMSKVLLRMQWQQYVPKRDKDKWEKKPVRNDKMSEHGSDWLGWSRQVGTIEPVGAPRTGQVRVVHVQ